MSSSTSDSKQQNQPFDQVDQVEQVKFQAMNAALSVYCKTLEDWNGVLKQKLESTPSMQSMTTPSASWIPPPTPPPTPPFSTPPSLTTTPSVATTTPLATMTHEKHWLAGKVIVFEGNIGCGKTTLIDNIMKRLHAASTLVPNPWSGVVPLIHKEEIIPEFLALFYSNPTRYALAFQISVLSDRLWQMHDADRLSQQEGKTIFLDRGAVGDTIFATLAYESNYLTSEDFSAYKSICRKRLPAKISDNIHAIVLLDAPASECYRRMKDLRQYEAEEKVPLDYLEKLDTTYFNVFCQWMGQRESALPDVNIGKIPSLLILDWEHYGNEQYVLDELRKVLDGTRPSPHVAFQRFGDVETIQVLVNSTCSSIAHCYHSDTEIMEGYERVTKWKQECKTIVVPSASSSSLSSASSTSGSTPGTLTSSLSYLEYEDTKENVLRYLENHWTLFASLPTVVFNRISEQKYKVRASSTPPHPLKPPVSIWFNWDLTHSNEYKRLVMYYLTRPHLYSVLFYYK